MMGSFWACNYHFDYAALKESIWLFDYPDAPSRHYLTALNLRLARGSEAAYEIRLPGATLWSVAHESFVEAARQPLPVSLEVLP
ncbi:MAG: hypothetical protein JXR96_25810 [Deltaproteobacteria bacterium]|nr:hypothetical protein [Deltaproteobacteria bacterium]